MGQFIEQRGSNKNRIFPKTPQPQIQPGSICNIELMYRYVASKGKDLAQRVETTMSVRTYNEFVDAPEQQKVEQLEYLHYPFWTLLSSAFLIAVFCFEYYYSGGFIAWSVNPFFGPSLYALQALGARTSNRIYERHQYFRMCNSLALHAGVIHLLLSLAYHATLLWPAERRYGFHKVFPLYFISALVGNLFSIMFVPSLPSVGPNGAFAGLLSLRALELYVQRKSEVPATWTDWISFFISLLGLFGGGVLPYIDNFAQLGGLIIGFFIALCFIPELDPAVSRRVVVLVGLSGSIVCGAVVLGLFFYNTTPTTWCSYCYYVDCLPITGFCGPRQLVVQ
ncbi:inactive rhomboid protein 1-like protein [Planoprotostelium fungivorum]|uniref:rhomboid protease n=1 Tax=Planoprotostelium fungivorum TaxID=1890364 RepID=A0A2P6NSF2_9EUKA|nr:inactive rhomboid protein 1-like protein [Planoprotostelium fungivorum]